MSMLGFKFLIDSPIRLYMPERIYVITLQCTPVWGLYGFLLAVLSSLVMNTIMLNAHRRVAVCISVSRACKEQDKKK